MSSLSPEHLRALDATDADELWRGSASDDPIARVAGHALLEAVGRGAQGVVYRALDPAGAQVAFKYMLPATGASTDRLRRFRSEVELASGLDHPGIVRVLAAGEERGRFFVAFEWIDGRSLDEWAVGRMPDDVVALFARLGDAIGHAHECGVLHRDLKPSNVLVDAAGRPHVLDFGLARELGAQHSEVTSRGQFLGTLAYASPEQLEGRHAELDARSDLYSLGTMLYRCLTGELPFPPGDGLVVQRRNVEATAPPKPSSRVAGIRPELDAIVRRCLQVEPGRRYATVVQLTDDLRRYVRGDATDARPPTRRQRAWQAMRRHKVAAGVVALLAAIALLVFVGSVLVALAYVEQRRGVFAAWRRQVAEQRAVGAALLEGRFAEARSAAVDLALGRAHWARGAHADAQLHLERALSSADVVSLARAEALALLASVLAEAADPRAEPMAREALALAGREWPPKTSILATAALARALVESEVAAARRESARLAAEAAETARKLEWVPEELEAYVQRVLEHVTRAAGPPPLTEGRDDR